MLEFVALVDRAEEPWGDCFGQVKRQGGAGRGVQIAHAVALGRLLWAQARFVLVQEIQQIEIEVD